MIQLHDGIIVADTDGLGAALIDRARAHAAARPILSPEEKRDLRAWCRKMALRAQRGDAEGNYRWHWLITDSLSIYCDVRDIFYFGPGKTLKAMRRNDPESLRLLEVAMASPAALAAWVKRLFLPLA